MRSALIIGLAGEALTSDERSFLRAARPAGAILFTRNCRNRPQVRRLVNEARAAIGADDLLVLIDQEGGRVRRLRPPEWRELPAASVYGALHFTDSARASRAAAVVAQLVARDLTDIGINANCAPVLDLRVPGAHDVIGDRAYGRDPDQVARLGRAAAEGFLAGGVVPVIKHVPGHGRAKADSHLELPVVDCPRSELESSDFLPFCALRDMPAAMTAHVVYSAIDPLAPASASRKLTAEVIRGTIGFDGLLMSDDLGMGALSGPMRSRAEAVIGAGSDIALHCNGNLAEAESAAAGVPPLTGKALERYQRCIGLLGRIEPFDVAAAEASLSEMLRAMA